MAAQPEALESPTPSDRIDQYHAETLLKEDSLQACLGSTTAVQLKIGHYLQQAIIRVLAESPDSIEDHSQVNGPLNVYLRVMRQVDRHAQLEARLREPELSASDLRARLRIETAKHLGEASRRPCAL